MMLFLEAGSLHTDNPELDIENCWFLSNNMLHIKYHSLSKMCVVSSKAFFLLQYFVAPNLVSGCLILIHLFLTKKFKVQNRK